MRIVVVTAMERQILTVIVIERAWTQTELFTEDHAHANFSFKCKTYINFQNKALLTLFMLLMNL